MTSMTVRLHDLPAMADAALRRYEKFTGTRLVILEGCGRDGHGVVREVTYSFDEEGVLIRRDDPAEQT